MQSPSSPSQVRVTLRIVQVAMLVSVFLYMRVGEMIIGQRTDHEQAPSILPYLGIAAAFCAGVALFVRNRLIGNAEQALRASTLDSAALLKWQSLHIMMFAFAEAVALFGFAWRFLGGELSHAAIFYAAGFVLLLLGSPRRLD
jgi:hypothetical protein